MSWWVELGYPPFDAGKGGFPKTGQVVKYYRERKLDDKGKPYTQKAFAKVLGISDIAVREIENRGAGMDFERRQFLCKLFNIPPILLGVVTLEQINKLLEEKGITLSALLSPIEPVQRSVTVSTPVSTAPKLVVSVNEYHEQLVSYWKTEYSNSAYGGLVDALSRTSTLYQELPHVSLKERRQLYELLCSYHQFIAHVLRDKQLYNDAITHMNKAYRLAGFLRSNEQKALTLYWRGYILSGTDHLNKARLDFEKAMQYEKELSDYLNSPIRMYAGLVDAKVATTKKDQENAIALLDSGGKLVRANRTQENPYFLDFSLNCYHSNKSAALLAVGKNRDALDELKLVRGSTRVQRQVYNDILEAQAYTNQGDYCRAATLVETALLTAQDLQSEKNIARIVTIFQQLQQSPYKNNPDVARLEYLLYYKA
jgi:hypothetical protein